MEATAKASAGVASGRGLGESHESEAGRNCRTMLVVLMPKMLPAGVVAIREGSHSGGNGRHSEEKRWKRPRFMTAQSPERQRSPSRHEELVRMPGRGRWDHEPMLGSWVDRKT